MEGQGAQQQLANSSNGGGEEKDQEGGTGTNDEFFNQGEWKRSVLLLWIFPISLFIYSICSLSSGLKQWEEARAQWLSSKQSDTDSTSRAAVPIEVDEIIDVIFSPRWRNPGEESGPPRRFPQNVPLPQMVDVLADLWEAEGLDT